MAAAMVIFAALCILIGIFPESFYQFLPYATDYVAYKPGKVVFYLQLLLFSGLAFFLLLPLMKRTLTISLDADWFWRVVFFRLGSIVYDAVGRVGGALESAARAGAGAAIAKIERGKGGRLNLFARSQPIATTALWIALLLTGYVLAYFF